jgi:hypothetical protein
VESYENKIKFEAILTPITAQTSELFKKLSYEELANMYTGY